MGSPSIGQSGARLPGRWRKRRGEEGEKGEEEEEENGEQVEEKNFDFERLSREKKTHNNNIVK